MQRSAQPAISCGVLWRPLGLKGRTSCLRGLCLRSGQALGIWPGAGPWIQGQAEGGLTVRTGAAGGQMGALIGGGRFSAGSVSRATGIG